MSREALVLCGGLGTRFRDISLSPKILIPFRDALFIDWIIKYLKTNKYENITFSVGYKSEEIVNYLKKFYDCPEIKTLFESTPLGTGGAVKLFFDSNDCNQVTVMNGDTFLSHSIPEEFNQQNKEISCLVKKVHKNDRFGHFVIENEKLIVDRGLIDQPIYNSQIFLGVARVSRVLDFSTLKIPFSLEDIFKANAERVHLVCYPGSMLDFGIPKDYDRMIAKYGS